MEEIKVEQSVSSQLKDNKNTSFLVMLLSILLLISVFIAGFFAWKTQQLVKDLTAYRIQPTQTPTPSPITDPTANWKTFSSTLGYSIRYPDTLTLEEQSPATYFLLINSKDSQSGAFWIDERQMDVKMPPDDKTKVFTIKNNKVSINCIKEYCESTLYEEILSTLKFIDPETSSSPLPIACTMDAKICPDGSAVGRSGPKCEFAPCPTPKN